MRKTLKEDVKCSFLIVLLTLALAPQAYALDFEAFLEDLKARKGFDQAILKLTVKEAGFILGTVISDAGKSCEVAPTRWMVRGKDSKGNTLLAVHCERNSTDFLIRVPLDPDAKSGVSFCSEMEKLGFSCWRPLD